MLLDNLKLKGDVAIKLFDKDGNIKQEENIKNLVVDAGLDFIASRMVGTGSSIMSHMGIGSGTTAAVAGDHNLESILGSRITLSSAEATSKQVLYVASFGAGVSTGAVTESAIFNASSGGSMLCRTTFSVINKGADDTLQINWTISLAAA